MKNVLFISDSFTTAIRLIPVYIESKKDNSLNSFFFTTSVADRSLKELFAEHNIDYITAEDVWTDNDKLELKSLINQYSNIYLKETSNCNPYSLEYKGVPLLSAVQKLLLELNTGKITYFFLFDKIVKLISPDILVVAYDSGGSKKSYVNRARQLGIKTLHVQYSYYPQKLPFERKRLNSEYYCLWGESHLEPFLQGTQDNNKVFFTGNPAFDVHNYNRSKLRSELGLTENNKVFLVAISNDWNEISRFIRESADLKLHGNEVFLFKLHPDFYLRTKEAAAMLKKTSLNYMLFGTEISGYKAIVASDYVFAFYPDGFWIESYYYKKPSIRVHGPIERQPKIEFDFLEGTYISINNVAEINMLTELDKNIDWDKHSEACKQLFYKVDYCASKRIVTAIKTILT
jgi:hypothetical protein